MTDTTIQVAKTILAQLGGGQRLNVMIGARDVLALPSGGVQFTHMRGIRGANKLCIELDQNDTYTVQFWKIRGLDCTKLSEVSGVYADSLARVVEWGTGLALHL